MPPSGLMPPIGVVTSCGMHTADVPLRLDVLGTVQLSFRGGIRLRAEENLRTALGGVKQRVVGFEVADDSPVLGRVTMSLADTDATPLSVLELISQHPPAFRQTIFLDFNVTIEKPPDGGPPLVLFNTRTAKLVGTKLTAFPPQGSVYQLQEPIDLAPVDAPSEVIAQLMQFPTTVSHEP